MALEIKCFTFNPFMENTYVVYDETKEAVIIDPGCYEPYEQNALRDFIEEEGLTVIRLLNTHAHIDHVLGNSFVKRTYQVGYALHKKDLETLRAVPAYAPSYGFAHYEAEEPDSYLEEGDTISLGNTELKVLFTPGHAPGHVVFYHEDSQQFLGGDVLFQGSVGRTDLPGGDMDTLINSIHTKLFTLPDAVKVYPGHGPATTIGEEKQTNPFCKL